MNEAAVRMLERVCEVQTNQRHSVRGELLAKRRFEQRAKVQTVDELEGHVVDMVDLAHVDDTHDVRVPKLRGKHRLTPETRDELRIPAEGR